MILPERNKKLVLQHIARVTGSNSVCFPEEILLRVFDSLTTAGNVADVTCDRFGNWNPRNVSGELSEQFSTPWLDKLLLDLSGSNPASSRKTVWPENRPFALCLTHDVDFVSRLGNVDKLCRRLKRLYCADGPKYLPLYQSLGSAYRIVSSIGCSDSLGHYEDWLKLEDTFGYKSTFYFFSYPSRRESVYDCDFCLDDIVTFNGSRMTVAGMVREIDKAGWEIGLHGSIHSSTDQALLSEQKNSLEEIVQKEVISIRNHYLNYSPLITPQVQAQAGFKTDSTVGFNSMCGFRAGTSFPYWCWDVAGDNQLQLLEIPLVLMDVSLFYGSGCVDIEQAVSTCISLMDEVQQVGGCLTLNWHPNYLNDELFFKTYELVLQEASSRKAWGCSANQLYECWVQRVKSEGLLFG